MDLFKMPLKLKQVDREYQANYNLELDNGVILKEKNMDEKDDKDDKDEKQTKDQKLKKDKKERAKMREKLEEEFKERQKEVIDDTENQIFKNEFRIDYKIVKLVHRLGYEEKYTKECLKNNENNYCTTTYYLLQKN